ncbi:hypothetical protein Nepgr_021619 [Nepenthes gracilis]|uniref:Uncharacterized protein n=1 Tax=Nepenthes gracilis TaxID=150966 RepID=A0AAD3SYJ6_NEPGR|nr:hypothetical protein Nepgr_021619 [Nepenthes gracilis]
MFGRRSSIFVLILLVALAAFLGVSTARPLPEFMGVGNGNSNNWSAHGSVYEMTKHSLEYWLQRLSSGPSDGAGH